MFKSILVVCAGNICRSPTGEYVFKDLLAGRDIRVSSAGLTALVGKSADKLAQSCALESNIDLSPHIAQQISQSLVLENDLILVMEQRHLEDVCAQYPQVRGKVFLLTKWLEGQDVPDPYRQGEEAFKHVFELITNAANAWQKYL